MDKFVRLINDARTKRDGRVDEVTKMKLKKKKHNVEEMCAEILPTCELRPINYFVIQFWNQAKCRKNVRVVAPKKKVPNIQYIGIYMFSMYCNINHSNSLSIDQTFRIFELCSHI